MRIIFLIGFVLGYAYTFAQNKLPPTASLQAKELDFYPVENTKLALAWSELQHFKIIDSIANPYSFIIKKGSTVFIAIKKENKFITYQLLSRSEHDQQNSISADTLSEVVQNDSTKDKSTRPKLRLSHPTEVIASNLYVTGFNRISLDKFMQSELYFKFIYVEYKCPACSVPGEKKSEEGYIIFDFDKLQALEITTLNNTGFIRIDHLQNTPVAFKKNYIKIGSSKYYYENNKLVRKSTP